MGILVSNQSGIGSEEHEQQCQSVTLFNGLINDADFIYMKIQRIVQASVVIQKIVIMMYLSFR